MGGTLEAGAAALGSTDVQMAAETAGDPAEDVFSDAEGTTVQQPETEEDQTGITDSSEETPAEPENPAETPDVIETPETTETPEATEAPELLRHRRLQKHRMRQQKTVQIRAMISVQVMHRSWMHRQQIPQYRTKWRTTQQRKLLLPEHHW